MAFAFLFPEKPRSVQAEKLSQYKARIKAYVRPPYQDDFLEGDLYARIIWFYTRTAEGDVDNIIKPILDALEGIVYKSDNIIVKVASERFDKQTGINLLPKAQNSVEYIYAELGAILLDQAIPNFVYIEIGVQPQRRLKFGPIDGGDDNARP